MSETHMSEVTEAITRRRREWVEAVNARDLDRYAKLVTEDLVWLPPMGEPIEGREAFRAWLQPFFESWEYDFSVEASRVQTFDGWCVERGRFLSRLAPAGGGRAREHGGEYLVLWRLDADGAWRIERYADVTSSEPEG